MVTTSESYVVVMTLTRRNNKYRINSIHTGLYLMFFPREMLNKYETRNSLFEQHLYISGQMMMKKKDRRMEM